MENYPTDDETPLEQLVDELFIRSDALVFEALNKILELIREENT